MSSVIRGLCLAPLIAAGLLTTEITGKVIAVNGDTVTIAADDAKAQPRAGDSVAIYFQIPGLDDPAKVGSGQVASVQGGQIIARIDQRTGSLAVGQIAKIQASGKPAPPRAASAATPGAGCAGWTGRWKTDFGEMTLENGGGQYNFKDGTIESITVASNSLEGKWRQSNGRHGWLRFELKPDGSFTGTWGYDDPRITGGTWNGSCLGSS